MNGDGQPANLRDIYDVVLSSSNLLRDDIKDVRTELLQRIDGLQTKVGAVELDTATTISTLRTNLAITTGNVEALLGRVAVLETKQVAVETRQVTAQTQAATRQDHHDRVRDAKRWLIGVAALVVSSILGGLITVVTGGTIHK